MAVNHIIFGLDGENWNWLLIGYIYMFSKKPNLFFLIFLLLAGIFVSVHFMDNTKVLDKWIKNNLTYLYEFILVFFYFLYVYLYFKHGFIKTPFGKVLFILISFSNIYRFVASAVIRIKESNFDIVLLNLKFLRGK